MKRTLFFLILATTSFLYVNAQEDCCPVSQDELIAQFIESRYQAPCEKHEVALRDALLKAFIGAYAGGWFRLPYPSLQESLRRGPYLPLALSSVKRVVGGGLSLSYLRQAASECFALYHLKEEKRLCALLLQQRLDAQDVDSEVGDPEDDTADALEEVLACDTADAAVCSDDEME